MATWGVSIAVALLLSSQVGSSTSSPTPLIRDVCAGFDFQFCVQTLASEPRVVAATTLVGIAIALIEAGISNSAKTQLYVQKMLAPHPRPMPADYIYVLRQCDAAYSYYIGSFRSAAMEVKDRDYETSNYDIEVSMADGIRGQCQEALVSTKIKDAVISKGNDVMILFGEVAAKVLDRLYQNKRI